MVKQSLFLGRILHSMLNYRPERVSDLLLLMSFLNYPASLVSGSC